LAAAITIELLSVSEDAENAVELAAGALAVNDRKQKKRNSALTVQCVDTWILKQISHCDNGRQGREKVSRGWGVGIGHGGRGSCPLPPG